MNNKTINYYNKYTKSFIQTTRSVDFTNIQNKFLSYLPSGASILDFGCGSGRDTKYFLKRNYKSALKVGALGSPRKLHLFAKASPFGRGVTAGDGEGEDADHVQQPYSKNSFHGAAAGRGREKAMGLPVSGWTNCSPALCRAMSPLNRLPYLPSP